MKNKNNECRNYRKKKLNMVYKLSAIKKKQNKGLRDLRASGWRGAEWYIFIGFINVPDARTLQGKNNKGNSCEITWFGVMYFYMN